MKKIAALHKGAVLSANLQYRVQFQTSVNGNDVKFFAHLVRSSRCPPGEACCQCCFTPAAAAGARVEGLQPLCCRVRRRRALFAETHDQGRAPACPGGANALLPPLPTPYRRLPVSHPPQAEDEIEAA